MNPVFFIVGGVLTLLVGFFLRQNNITITGSWLIAGFLGATFSILIGEFLIKRQGLDNAAEKSARFATFLTAIVIASFAIWSNLPNGEVEESAVHQQDVQTTTWVDYAVAWLQLNTMSLSLLAVGVITTGALLSGFLGILKERAVVTKWFVYVIAGIGIISSLYYVGTEMIFGVNAGQQRGYFFDLLSNRFDMSPPVLLPPGSVTTPNNGTDGIVGITWTTIGLITTLIVGMVMIFWPQKKGG